MKQFVFWLLVCISLAAGLVEFAMDHEYVHQAIYTSYGINSTAGMFGHGAFAYTIAETDCREEGCIAAHNFNESIGYQGLALLYNLWLMFILFLLFMSNKNKWMRAAARRK